MAENLQIFDKYYNGINKIKVTNTNNEQVTYVKEPVLQKKYITTDGIYDASDEGIDGYSSLEVDVVDKAVVREKNITKKGTYYAMDDGVFGYNKVIVRGIESVVGEDPDDSGDEAEATVDEQTGKIKIKKIPSSINITAEPTKLVYNDGEQIDYSDMIVKAYLKSGAVFTDETYPDGIIPHAELNKPAVVPSGDVDSDDPHVTPEGIYYISDGGIVECCTQLNTRPYPGEINYLKVPAGVRFATFYNRPENYYVVAASKEDFLYLQQLHTWDGQSEPVVEVQTRAIRITVDGEDYYYATGYWYSPLPEPSGSIEYNPIPDGVQLQVYAIQMMFSASSLRRVPVNWLSPYGKGETFTDSFNITVNPIEN